MFETSNNVGVVGMADNICTVNYYVRGFNDEKMDGVAVSVEQAYEVGTSPAVSDLMETSNFAVCYPSMQIFTFGPNVYDAHTINEHVEIGSIEHAWKYTLELLKNID